MVKRRGAPKGNKNASGHGRPLTGRKLYFPIAFFGQRWGMEEGQKIEVYLQHHQLSQAQQVRVWVERDILKI